MKRLERWDKLYWYALVAVAVWAIQSLVHPVAKQQESLEGFAAPRATRVYPYGKIDGFFVYVIEGAPGDPLEPRLTLTLTPIDEPDCNIVWSLVGEPPVTLFFGPMGCKGPYKSREFYEKKLLEAFLMYSSGLEA